MAEGTFYIRPSADISLGHPVYPETLGAGYLAINEEIADGKATYIGVTTAPDGDVLCSSIFRMALDEEAKITKVLTATLRYSGDVQGNVSSGGESYCTCDFSVSGGSVFSGKHYEETLSDDSEKRGDSLSDADMPNMAAAINSYISSNGAGSFPEITVAIANFAGHNNGTKSINVSYVSQVYVELVCEYSQNFGVHRKVNGSWVAATAAYQKQSGSWVEITADECRAILSGNALKS